MSSTELLIYRTQAAAMYLIAESATRSVSATRAIFPMCPRHEFYFNGEEGRDNVVRKTEKHTTKTKCEFMIYLGQVWRNGCIGVLNPFRKSE